MNFYDYFSLVALIVIYSTVIGRTIFLHCVGIKPFVLGAGKKGINAFMEIGFFLGMILIPLEIIKAVFKLDFYLLPRFFFTPLFEADFFPPIGVIAIIFGYYLFAWGVLSLGKSWRVGIDTKSPGELVTTGAFKMSRNPIFVFMDLYLFGTFLIYSNLFFLISVIVLVTGLHLQILYEEAFLKKKYGREYEEYMVKVGRYL